VNVTKNKVPQCNYDNLATFLKRITPGVMQFLDEQYGTNAFNDYDLSGEGEPCTDIHLINRLNSFKMSDFKVILNLKIMQLMLKFY
jgi:hypothetical protein